ncbi:hypothetical protein [Amycolatopsis taiwanensis]|uniref:hypothetical protein n=1 Tax=Amycolatopsis taiwanensis TaxID=342230 RepID=UPI0004831F3A|nr:hypothetical protein [Amycolatopsis taiwanensis]
MATLRAPDGRTYRTEDESEIRTLTLGHGYTVVADEPAAVRPPSPDATTDAELPTDTTDTTE